VPPSDCRHERARRRFWDQGHKYPRRAEAHGFGGPVSCGELGHGKVLNPVVLLVFDIGPEVLFHGGVHSLRLSVGLGVGGSTEAKVDRQTGVVFPEPGGKLGATVRDDGTRQAVETEGLVDK